MDRDFRLAVRLAREAGLIHPLDWIAVYESHNEFEWMLQRIVDRVDPHGDELANIREGVIGARMIAANGLQKMDDEDVRALAKDLSEFLPVHDPQRYATGDQESLDRVSERVKRRKKQ